MSAAPQHKRGERVKIFWPGGQHDFVIEFHRIAHDQPPTADPKWADWITLYGTVVEPADQYRAYRGFWVHHIDGGYELLPKLAPAAPGVT